VESNPEQSTNQPQPIQQSLPPKNKFPIKFFLLFVLISTLIAFIAGGLFFGAKQIKLNQQKVIVSPTPLPAATSVKESDSAVSWETKTGNQQTGLIVIRSGADGEELVRKIALEKKWDFITVNSSDIREISEVIRNIFNQKHFEYLLLVGSNEEIPLAQYDSVSGVYVTDPALYGDIDDDGLVELAVGRLPFSSSNQIQEYFTDLGPKGDTISFDNYPFVVGKIDPQDTMLVGDFGYEKACIIPLSPNFNAYQMSNSSVLVKHYYDSAVIELRTHGSDDGISLTTDRFQWPPNFTIDGFKDTTGKLNYFDNRPIIVHMSCNNAKILGSQLLENGASAFLGFYNPSGYAPAVTQQLLAGKSVGETMRDMDNTMRLRPVHFPYWNEYLKKYDYDTQISNFIGTNTFDLADNSIKTKPVDSYGFELYGDPSLTLPESFRKESTVKMNLSRNEITITASPVEVFDATPSQDVLCYTSALLSDPSFVMKQIWNKNHRLMLSFPVNGINKLLTYSIYVGGKKLERGDETVNLSLVKGKRLEYVIGFVDDYKSTENAPPSRFDNSKELKIVVSYE
jgi:hypothetical protein